MLMDQQLCLRIKDEVTAPVPTARDRGPRMEGLQGVRSLLQGIDKCTEDIKSIQTKLQLSIEKDIQGKLDDEIQGFREMLAAIHLGPSGQSGPASGPSPGRARVWAARARRRAGPGLYQGSGPGLSFRKPGP
ncbi:hypothetical protein GGX14DRAFT_404999 [Mycena pura]|uniref:Uncharacterized protein n=1 Tax=Mycena pura TaxID=153505 RepID=A0AAD6UT42_9AGAR|nr:hypothetical protein GGX14DRAFT_404999 [Mycena pura]